MTVRTTQKKPAIVQQVAGTLLAHPPDVRVLVVALQTTAGSFLDPA